jgi:RNA polymerase sigma-32 factor
MKTGHGSLQPEEVAHIARELKVKPEEVLEMEGRLGGHEISLESHFDEYNEESFSPIAYLEDQQPEPSEMLSAIEQEHLQTTGLANALSSLDERSRRIVEARWLNQGENATLHDLAEEFGVSAERIRQIEQKAMQKMKGLLAA